jgi:hypothetical protein
MTALRRACAALTDLFRVPTPTCCPHLDMGDDPDTAYLPADTTRHDYRGSVTNG